FSTRADVSFWNSTGDRTVLRFSLRSGVHFLNRKARVFFAGKHCLRRTRMSVRDSNKERRSLVRRIKDRADWKPPLLESSLTISSPSNPNRAFAQRSRYLVRKGYIGKPSPPNSSRAHTAQYFCLYCAPNAVACNQGR